MTDDKVRVSHLVPEETRDKAQERARHGALSEAVRQVYRDFARGETYPGHASDAAKKAALNTEDERLRGYQESVEEVRQDMAEHVAEMEERHEQRMEARAEYEEHLEALEDRLRDGKHVDAGHGAVIDAAECSARAPSRVIEELKQRNPDIPDHAFQPADETDQDWPGVTEEGNS